VTGSGYASAPSAIPPRDRRDRSPPFATVGYWGVGFAGGCLPAFPLGFGPVELWWGPALGLVAVAVLLIPR
jgi:hypothetical protein